MLKKKTHQHRYFIQESKPVKSKIMQGMESRPAVGNVAYHQFFRRQYVLGTRYKIMSISRWGKNQTCSLKYEQIPRNTKSVLNLQPAVNKHPDLSGAGNQQWMCNMNISLKKVFLFSAIVG